MNFDPNSRIARRGSKRTRGAGVGWVPGWVGKSWERIVGTTPGGRGVGHDPEWGELERRREREGGGGAPRTPFYPRGLLAQSRKDARGGEGGRGIGGEGGTSAERLSPRPRRAVAERRRAGGGAGAALRCAEPPLECAEPPLPPSRRGTARRGSTEALPGHRDLRLARRLALSSRLIDFFFFP